MQFSLSAVAFITFHATISNEHVANSVHIVKDMCN